MPTQFLILKDDGTQTFVGPGAVIYVDGVEVGIGEATILTVADGSHEVTVKCPGFNPKTQTVTFPQSNQTILLSTASPITGRIPFSLSVSPSNVVGASYTYVKALGGDTVSGAIIQDGAEDFLLKDTQYNLTINAPNYSPQTIAIDTRTDSSTLVSLALVSDTVSQAQNIQPQLKLVDVGGNPISTRNSQLTPPEFVYPNSVDGKYFTTTQARLYVGNVFIDEINWIQFALQDNKVPVYGYRSRYFDAMAQGKSLVQGQLGINFVSEGYLWTVLNEYERLSIDTLQLGDNDFDRINQLSALEDQIQTSDVVARKKEILVNLPPTAIDKLKKRRIAKAQGSFLGYTNPLYLDVPFDLEIELQGGGRTVTRRLEKCFLIGNEQVLDQSGIALVDGYSFIARRLR